MQTTTKKRIVGFDLARAYAIFGMYLVNFNLVFGDYNAAGWTANFLQLFSGNSSTVFVMLAGMGTALLTNRPFYQEAEKKQIKRLINRRAWFLFFLGLLLYTWWPADILHFYGGYMHIAAFLVFWDKKFYLYTALAAIGLFHILLFIIPYESGWNFETLQYLDFWTVDGFLRNTFYNGWNAVFPWMAYFAVGMYLGRLDWFSKSMLWRVFLTGLVAFCTIALLQGLSSYFPVPEGVLFYIQADYLPPFLPFVISTLGFGMMLIAALMYISSFVSESRVVQHLAKVGQMTLTHYISHLTLGMVLVAVLTGRPYAAELATSSPLPPLVILGISILYFIVSYYFSIFWLSRYKKGPFELLMRKIAG